MCKKSLHKSKMSLMDYKKYVKALFETDLKRYERIDRVLNMELKTE